MAEKQSSPGFAKSASTAELSAGARAVLAMARLHDDTGLILEQENIPTEVTGNDVLSMAWRIGSLLSEGKISLPDLQAVTRHLRDDAFLRRATRLHRYPGGTNPTVTAERLQGVVKLVMDTAFGRVTEAGAEPTAERTPAEALEAFRAELERIRYAAVFTAHPTFAVANEVYTALAEYASAPESRESAPALVTHRRSAPPTLEEEFTLASEAILRGRDALDRLNAALLSGARDQWPEEWSRIVPKPVVMTSWVGYDTDGRTDIGWWDTLRLRLRMKLFQLQRLRHQITESGVEAAALMSRLSRACYTVEAQIAACPKNADADATVEFATLMVERREDAILEPAVLSDALQDAIDTAPPEVALALAVARAGFFAHGMSASHSHTRLNATQIHNVIRQRLRFTDDPADPAHRRALLARMNEALETVEAVPVDFGSLLVEQASAARLMMTVAQIVKHIDTATQVRFLIAETESGYTLLSALWLAKNFGIEDRIEISPLFETREALMGGAHIIEEALRSPHWREYLRKTGRLSLQFGYSDSGRYVGQLAATYLVERLRLKILDLLHVWDMEDVEVILFDTHGESVGRGGHPFRLADRFSYLSPMHVRARFAERGVKYREESAFQGGDGYLLFGTPDLAAASVVTIAEHTFEPCRRQDDPVYDEPDFSSDFFSTIAEAMTGLVEDPGYADVLGAFGPSLIDKTGSRPAARQTEGGGAVPRITHPSQLRAIPNNAILQQLGWCANTIQGLGSAARRHPETFETFREGSARFRRALDFAAHALAHSDDQVLRSVIWLLDPGYWLDRATAEPRSARRERYLSVMHDLERLDFWADTQSMFRRIQADHLALRAVWPEAPTINPSERLLHAIRIALIEQSWVLATQIPFFMPRGNFTREVMMQRILCLEIPAVLREMNAIFPHGGPKLDYDFHEPAGPQLDNSYQWEHEEIFQPIQDMFGTMREISVAIMHGIGAFG
ncbi:phosphoenolpyruvate carboxylase [Acetobacter conturbans]|uniref:Phosphoenolpyruvate carboxylase n=1 Tax=Acetobacter conturbans TaxID=1737472 RepID=A0ABX0K244_9PROT|nr:phosphoenolpyruvate carboxylase [Acetobacter conturbans]NHN89179.1 phosphoenolpyruvate carboxylase [Acetobacter conturbans]